MDELEYRISQLVDNELSDSEQTELFAELSVNIEARKSFAEFLKIKKEIGSYYSGFNMTDISIAQKTHIPRRNVDFIYKIGFYSSIAASIILAVMLFIGQTNNSILENKIELLNANNSTLSKMLADFNKNTAKKEIVNTKSDLIPEVKSKTGEALKVKPQKHIITEAREMLKKQAALMQLTQNKVVINSNDFIGGKVVAN